MTSQSGTIAKENSYTTDGWYATGTTYNIPVTFPKAFDKVPTVKLSYSGQHSDNTITGSAINVTQTVFSAQIKVSKKDKFTTNWQAQA